MMGHLDDRFDEVQQEQDPVRQARLAGELIEQYRQRSTELARLRREAVNRAVAERGTTYSVVAEELGLTRGRISQIRQDRASQAESEGL